MKRRVTFLIVVGALLFLSYICVIFGYGVTRRGRPSELCVVLGNTVHKDGTPSDRLKARLDKAFDLHQAGYCETIVVSGGFGREGYDEAMVMKAYLVSRGVPKSRIVADPSGRTTLATAKFVKQYCDRNGVNSVIAVSQHFHLLRTRIALKRVGVQQQISLEAPVYFEWRDLYSLLRETAAIPVYTFRDL